MSSDYTGAPGATQAPGPKPSLTSYPIGRMPADGDPLAAASVQQDIKEAMDYIAYLIDRSRDQLFGDGSDGDQINPGFLGLSGPKFYNTVSIGAAANVDTGGWPLICRTSFTLNHASGVLRCNGGTAATNTRKGYNGNITAGPHGSICPSNGLASGSYPYTGQVLLGLGGSGGSGGGSGPSGTTIASPGNAYKMHPYRFASSDMLGSGLGTLFAGSTNPNPGLCWDTIRGGGAGGCGGVAASSTGGAGGAGGGLVVVIAPSITLTAGACQSIGGDGGAGQGTTGHGGGGGGGGAFLFICQSYTNAGVTFTATAGNGGLGAGAGSPGNAGTAGNTTPFVVLVP